MNSFDFKSLEKRERAKFINSLSGFKSANLVGTKSNKGQTNLSIISSAFHLGANPALIGFIIRPDTIARHTLNNIRENMFSTLNHVTKEIYQRAHQSSARYPEDVSEFNACGLTEIFHEDFLAPFVKESPIALSLKLIEEVPIKHNGTHLLINEIQNVYLSDSLVEKDGHVDIEKAGTICVSGLDSYHETNLLERLPYAKP